MDSKGRLHMPKEDGTEFVGKTFEETGMNRQQRRKEASENRKITKLSPGNPQHFQKKWLDFVSKVYLSHVPESQLQEMKIVFFSGALIMMNQMFALIDGDEPTEKDLLRMEHISEELHTYPHEYLLERLPVGGSS